MGLSKRILGIVTTASLCSMLPVAPISFVPLISAPAYADIAQEVNSRPGGKEVTVEGEGETKEAAIANARRLAVENVMGAYVTSTTDVKNFQVVKDEIRTDAEGFVSQTDVIDEGQRGGVFWVKAKCIVSQVPILKKLALKGLLRAWRISVLIKPPDKGDFTGDEAKEYRQIKDATQRAETMLYELLASSGFKTVNAGENPQVREQILSHISDLNAMAAVASKLGIDVLIVGNAKVEFGQANVQEAYAGIKTTMVPAVATLDIKALRVSTREVISAKAFIPRVTDPDASGYGNTIYTTRNGYGIAAAEAMVFSANLAGSALLTEIAKLPAATAAILQVVVKNISIDRADDIEEALKGVQGIASVHAEDWAAGQVSYELKVTGSAKEAAKLVTKALQKLKLSILSRDSSKITASGK